MALIPGAEMVATVLLTDTWTPGEGRGCGSSVTVAL